MADTNLLLEVTMSGLEPSTVARDYTKRGARDSVQRLGSLLAAIAGGVRHGRVRTRVDSVTPYAARIALVLTQANIAAGETISLVVPHVATYTFTAVASGADTANYGFNSATSDDATGESLALAINSSPGTKDFFSATNASGTVTIVCKKLGAWGNNCVALDGTVNGVTGEGNFAGGLDASSRVSSSVVITHANVSDGDTLAVGGVTFTWRASPSGESEIDIGTTATEDGDNLVTAVEAHSKLAGLVTAANAAGTVTITGSVDPRAALHVLALSTSDATAFAVTQPTTNLTLASQEVSTLYSLGSA